MAHKERVLRYMQDNGSITHMEAVNELGVMRLAAVVFELRKDGLDIETERVKGVNRFGEKVYFARYSLAD